MEIWQAFLSRVLCRSQEPDLRELKPILDGLPDKTLNIRGEGYDSRNIRILAESAIFGVRPPRIEIVYFPGTTAIEPVSVM
jgi:hypothetical protein